ncbi:hypothetical protein JL721_8893 [Aureococcus anophagefferens]|nr:hypothetical protein JL721_8893 [Aureococcus anophagefferens]
MMRLPQELKGRVLDYLDLEEIMLKCGISRSFRAARACCGEPARMVRYVLRRSSGGRSWSRRKIFNELLRRGASPFAAYDGKPATFYLDQWLQMKLHSLKRNTDAIIHMPMAESEDEPSDDDSDARDEYYENRLDRLRMQAPHLRGYDVKELSQSINLMSQTMHAMYTGAPLPAAGFLPLAPRSPPTRRTLPHANRPTQRKGFAGRESLGDPRFKDGKSKAVYDCARWYLLRGGERNGVEAKMTDYGLGLVASGDVAAGEAVLTTPRAWIVSAEDAPLYLSATRDDPAADLVTETAAVSARFVELEGDGMWEPYLAALPTADELGDMPALWPGDEAAGLLAGTQTGRSRAELLATLPGVGYAVLPFIDLANHDDAPNAKLRVDEADGYCASDLLCGLRLVSMDGGGATAEILENEAPEDSPWALGERVSDANEAAAVQAGSGLLRRMIAASTRSSRRGPKRASRRAPPGLAGALRATAEGARRLCTLLALLEGRPE